MCKQIVINSCFGGFSISPVAALWLFEHGMKEIMHAVDEWFGGDKNSYRASLEAWKNYLLGDPEVVFSVTPFSPDEKFVLEVRPAQRDHPLLVQCVKELGERAFGCYSELKIIEIPDDIEWEIEEYDGKEWVSEKHRTWA
jgi:hypothetical protein